MIGLRTRVVVVDAVEDAAEEYFEAVVVVEASHHTRMAVMVMGVSVSAPIMVVVEATHHTRLEVAVPVLVGVVELSSSMEVTVRVATIHSREVVGVVELELEGPTSMKALVVLLTQHFGLIVRVTGAFMQPGDMTAMAENKAIKTIPTMINLNSGIDNGVKRMVMAIRK